MNYAAPVKLAPTMAAAPTTIDAALGVAINGVPIYDYSAAGELDINNYDAKVDTVVLGQLDNCGGHTGRGDDYHYHIVQITDGLPRDAYLRDDLVGDYKQQRIEQIEDLPLPPNIISKRSLSATS